MDPATTRRASDLPVTAKTEDGIRILFSQTPNGTISAGMAGNNPPAFGVVLKDLSDSLQCTRLSKPESVAKSLIYQ
jgi:hypothetical protein